MRRLVKTKKTFLMILFVGIAQILAFLSDQTVIQIENRMRDNERTLLQYDRFYNVSSWAENQSVQLSRAILMGSTGKKYSIVSYFNILTGMHEGSWRGGLESFYKSGIYSLVKDLSLLNAEHSKSWSNIAFNKTILKIIFAILKI